MSGGGPYVLACAFALPGDRLKRASVVCGLGPPDIGTKGVPLLQRLALAVGYPHLPGLTAWWFKRQPSGRLDLDDGERLKLLQEAIAKGPKPHSKDVPLLESPTFLALNLAASREAFSQGFEHATHDGTLACSDWGFKIEDIRPDLEVELWYATDDASVPFAHGEQILERLRGRARFVRGEGETHGSLEVNFMREYLGGCIGW